MGMEDFIDVPDSFSSFRNDMEGECKAVISKCELKEAKTGNKRKTSKTCVKTTKSPVSTGLNIFQEQ